MNNKICWSSPSNIAIIKYWGKHGIQLPMNPSLSFTLSDCKTKTCVEWQENANQKNCSIEFRYDGKPKQEFEDKLRKYILSLEPILPSLKKLHLKIDSVNTFPHSAGIASSASAMSALALCLVSVENQLSNQQLNDAAFFRSASFIARIGSGSAARSLYPLASMWGAFNEIMDSSDEFAIPFEKELHPTFKNVQDCIFLVNQNEKFISSRAGHQLMENHPYRSGRIDQAIKNVSLLIQVLREGHWQLFTSVCEEEALSLHGLMMSSNPGYILLEPESLRILAEIKQFRKETQLPLAFTIDAGPNIHLLYPSEVKSQVHSWIQNQFSEYWNEKKLIFDKIGMGPQQIAE